MRWRQPPLCEYVPAVLSERPAQINCPSAVWMAFLVTFLWSYAVMQSMFDTFLAYRTRSALGAWFAGCGVTPVPALVSVSRFLVSKEIAKLARCVAERRL